MQEHTQNHIWRLLWEYDPNGLIAVDSNFTIVLVNPAFCRMFEVEETNILGQPASRILGNIDHFQNVWSSQQVIRGVEREYSHPKLYLREVVFFRFLRKKIIACIMVDITQEYQRRQELQHLKTETVLNVREVVDKSNESCSRNCWTPGEKQRQKLKLVC